jgi:hypothetical protein
MVLYVIKYRKYLHLYGYFAKQNCADRRSFDEIKLASMFKDFNYINTVGKVNMEHQLDATITVLLISKISSTCFEQTFAHLQERKIEMFLQHMV